jgi:hypothetical protein
MLSLALKSYLFFFYSHQSSSDWIYLTSLKNNDWNTNWKKERLNSEVVFVGVFEFNNSIYAIENKMIEENVKQVLYEYNGNATFIEEVIINY